MWVIYTSLLLKCAMIERFFLFFFLTALELILIYTSKMNLKNMLKGTEETYILYDSIYMKCLEKAYLQRQKDDQWLLRARSGSGN